MTIVSAVSLCSLTTTSFGPVSWARPAKVAMPAVSNSSTSPSEMPSRNSLVCACSAGQSVCGDSAMPLPTR